jgi:murein L,D-transpeptidase YcbB/YkuD
MRRKVFGITGGILVGWLMATAAGAVPYEPAREALRLRLETPLGEPPVVAGGDAVPAPGAVRDFYRQRLYEPAWLSEDGRIPQADALLAAINEAAAEGLDPSDYQRRRIAEVVQRAARLRSQDKLTARRVVDIELLMTSSWLTLASHSLRGKTDPETLDAQWEIARRDGDVVAALQDAIETGRVYERLRGMLPDEPGYAGLQDALTRYRRISEDGGWEPIPAGSTLRAGDEGERVKQLRERMGHTETVGGTEAGNPAVFDAELESAVKRFQARHGLEPDGLVGGDTLAALNVPVRDRIRQIRVNLERRRWLPDDLGERHIMVNIAGFEMSVVDAGEIVMRQRVIVGRDYRQTPVFSGRMTYLVLNPSWEVPHSIASRDLLREVQADQRYIDRMGFDIFRGWGANQQRIDAAEVDWQALSPQRMPYRFRQRPGPLNALGQVKFMFPNKHAVYLHDTPSRELFNRAERAFSSGCIRVQEPLALADHLLAGSERWSPDALRQALDSRREMTVALPQAMPVHLQYLTAWGSDGRLELRRDIYNRDAAVADALEAEHGSAVIDADQATEEAY